MAAKGTTPLPMTFPPQPSKLLAGKTGGGLPAKGTPSLVQGAPALFLPRVSQLLQGPKPSNSSCQQFLKAATRGQGRAVVLLGLEGDMEEASSKHPQPHEEGGGREY